MPSVTGMKCLEQEENWSGQGGVVICGSPVRSPSEGRCFPVFCGGVRPSSRRVRTDVAGPPLSRFPGGGEGSRRVSRRRGSGDRKSFMSSAYAYRSPLPRAYVRNGRTRGRAAPGAPLPFGRDPGVRASLGAREKRTPGSVFPGAARGGRLRNRLFAGTRCPRRPCPEFRAIRSNERGRTSG